MSAISQTQLEMRRGDTPVFNLSVFDPDDNNAPIDITGATIWMTAKASKDDADPGVFQISTTSGDITITDGSGGRARIVVPANATSAFTADRTLFFDVQVKLLVSSRVHTPVEGTLVVKRDITKTS